MYGEPDCQTNALPPKYSAVRAAQTQRLDQPEAEAELASQLSTLGQQAREALVIAKDVLERVSPQPDEGGPDAQAFGGGYIGQAERVRSIQSETIRTLLALAKLV
jgi:hypothetical protein